jgi:hypothetical protein
MWKASLKSVRDHLFATNPYLRAGYSAAWMDDYANKLLALGDNGEVVTVFPQDNVGDFFYLRIPNQVKYEEDSAQNMRECSVGYRTKADIVLVCMMRDADADMLVTNLVSSLQSYDSAYLRVKSAVYQNEYVIAQEFGKNKNLAEAALARVKKNTTFVSITFALEAPFKYINVNCITKPCKSC